MKDYSRAHNPAHSPAQAAANLSVQDEESPLLVKPAINGAEGQYRDSTNTRISEDGRLSKAKVLWIMSSVWIGTFVAGLGA